MADPAKESLDLMVTRLPRLAHNAVLRTAANRRGTIMKMTGTYPQLLASLNDVRRQWRVCKLLEGILLAFAGVVAVLLAVVAADNLFKLDKVGRSVLAVLLWGTLVAGLVGLIVRRFLEDRRDDFFAVLVEQKHPELRNQLINALQLGRGSQNGHSPRLIAAIVNDAATATADLDMGRSLDWHQTRRNAIFAGVATLLIAGYAIALWPYFTTGLARVLFPIADIPPYTATRVAVIHENDRVKEGGRVTIKARVTGEIPANALLFLKFEDGRWQAPLDMKGSDTLDNEDGKIFQLTIPQATRSFSYYVAAGDGQSSEYRIRVVQRPRLKELALAYTPPAYTGLKPRPLAGADGEISGLAGTTVTVRVTATKLLDAAELIARDADQGQKTVPLQKAGADNVWEGSFVLSSKEASGDDSPERIKAPGQYFIRVVDTDKLDNLDPQFYPLTLVRDQPPSVVITSPGRDLRLEPRELVDLAVEAQDDFGIDRVRILYRVNSDKNVRELTAFAHTGSPRLQATHTYKWSDFGKLGLKSGDRVEYWAVVTDRNNITGPGEGVSRPFTLTLLSPQLVAKTFDEQIFDFADAVEELITLQSLNRGQTTSGYPFKNLIAREVEIRAKTQKLSQRMEESALPLSSMIKTLDSLRKGLMADAIMTFQKGRDAVEKDMADKLRAAAVVIQDKIIAELKALLLRLQTAEQAKKALRKIKKDDPKAHKKITDLLAKMIKDMKDLLDDQTKLVAKLEKMPKKVTDETKKDKLKLTKEMDEMQKKWEKWAKGTVEELAKLPTGFVDDFNLRKDVNKVYEEIEKQTQRSKAEKIEVSLEDMGVGLGTKMKEDLESWLPDAPDAVKGVMEEPLNKKTPKVPEMPLPKALEDLIGDLLQKADEFDEEADDKTSAWGDNLDQAGWGVSDGPISSFSAKGKTGNDLPNNNEVSGRSGDGRRGKSSGQMVGDTAKNLQGRKTPARLNNEKYEPGQLKQESNADPQGATGGGKKAGAGRKGLQGGTPPDVVKNIGRLTAKQAGLREKAEQVAKKLNTAGIKSSRLDNSIALFKESEKDLRSYRYKDAARKRKEALRALKGAALEIDQKSGLNLSRSRNLPPELRKDLLQGADDGYPPGYEALLKNYYKELSKAEK
jgi:hypothetical protein